MAGFADNFNPFRWDILYGRREARTDYIESFLKSRQLKGLERRYQKEFTWKSVGYFINDYNETITKGDLSYPSEPKLFSNSSALDHYRGLLEKSKYAPKTLTESTWQDFAKGDITIQADTLRTRAEWTDAAQIAAVRKGCKFGIEYISCFRGATVHYALDGIDMAKVIGKETHALLGTTGVPITTSELRYLFREWGRYRDSTNLIFYNLMDEVKAPWVVNPDPWLPYAKQRVDKYRATLQNKSAGQLRNFDKLAAIPDAAKALPWFHDMKVGLT
jgi:hypothetical protein